MFCCPPVDGRAIPWGGGDLEVTSTNLSSGSKTDRALNCRVTERLLTVQMWLVRCQTAEIAWQNVETQTSSHNKLASVILVMNFSANENSYLNIIFACTKVKILPKSQGLTQQ